MKEADVQKWVKEQMLKKFEGRIYAFKMPAGPYGSRRGIPDLIFSIHGFFVAIEVKTTQGKPTKLQEHELKKIKEAGGLAFIIYGRNMSTIEDIVKRIHLRHGTAI